MAFDLRFSTFSSGLNYSYKCNKAAGLHEAGLPLLLFFTARSGGSIQSYRVSLKQGGLCIRGNERSYNVPK